MGAEKARFAPPFFGGMWGGKILPYKFQENGRLNVFLDTYFAKLLANSGAKIRLFSSLAPLAFAM